MKTLILGDPPPIFNEGEIIGYKNTEQAEKIIKDGNNITGYDVGGRVIFSHVGISDMSKFTLSNGEEWDLPTPTMSEIQQQTTQTKNDNSKLAEIVVDLLMWKLEMEV